MFEYELKALVAAQIRVPDHDRWRRILYLSGRLGINPFEELNREMWFYRIFEDIDQLFGKPYTPVNFEALQKQFVELAQQQFSSDIYLTMDHGATLHLEVGHHINFNNQTHIIRQITRSMPGFAHLIVRPVT